jgi:hypothetical protein
MSTSARERIPQPNLGAHELYFEPPCLLWVIQRGDITASEMAAILEPSTRLNARTERGLIVLINISDLGSIHANARKLAAEHANVYRALTVVGGNRVQRALGSLMLRVVNLVQQNAVKTKAFKNEREAYAWVKAELAEGKP